MARFFLVRHGNTEGNSAERFWGSTDVRLGADGIEAAQKLRDRLTSEGIDTIYSSSLVRASETAKIIASARRLPVTTFPELREIDFGKLEGLKHAEINQLYPEVVEQWNQRSPALKYPGGESLAELDSRVKRFFNDELTRHNSSQSVLIVAHSAVLRTLICQLLGVNVGCRWNFSLHLASLTVIENYPPKGVLALLNDTSHLDGK